MEYQQERLRSYVDPSTNGMLIADFELQEYLNWAKGRPVQGSQLLGNFLHEWTHRWCFDSRVGATLAFLRLRAGTRVFLRTSAFDDYVRSMTAMSLLEPLAEGLSLFAEFDAIPGESSFLSQTMTASGIFFSPAIDTEGRPDLLIAGMLQGLRREPELLERKASVFAKTGFDPYLIGYLSVKSLWKQLSGACKAFIDRDLFLSYLRSYIYDDPGMVVALLKSAPSEMHAAETIANHLLNRFVDLLSFQDLESKVALWISSAENGEVDVDSIASNSTIKREADLLLRDAIIEDFKKGGDYERLAIWSYMVLEERAICVLGRIDVLLTDSTDKKVRVINKATGESIYETDSPDLAKHREGQLFIIAGREAHGLLSIVGVEQQTFLVSSLGEFDESDLVLAKRLVANQTISNNFFELISAQLEKDGVVKIVWDFMKERLKDVQEKTYGPLCTLNANEAHWPEVFGKIKELGLHGMLGYNGELTRALAGVGLLNCMTLDIDFIKTLAPILDIDENALERLLEMDKVFGLPVIAKIDNSVLSLV